MAPIDVIGASLPRRRLEELGRGSSRRPETDHCVLRDVMLVVLRKFSHRSLLQPGVQHSIARTRRRRLIGVQTGRDHRLGKLGRERERVARMVTSSSSLSPGSGLSQGLTGLWSAVMTGLTSKCLRNTIHGLHCGGYKEVMYIPPWRCGITPSYPGYNHCLRNQNVITFLALSVPPKISSTSLRAVLHLANISINLKP
jgi:hypothetical protein